MIFRIGIENNNEGYRSIAWALEHPGCYAYGLDTDTARQALLRAIPLYAAWIESHEPAWLTIDEIMFGAEDTWTDFYVDEAYERVEKSDYIIDAFFLYDWNPLTATDIEHGLKLLSWSRADLLSSTAGLTQEKLIKKYPGERWSISGILAHVGGADWWYLDRLGLAFPRQQVPEDPMERLFKVRQHLTSLLPSLEGSKQVLGVDGEFWSPRKVLRRAVWHERDHTEHIRKLL